MTAPFVVLAAFAAAAVLALVAVRRAPRSRRAILVVLHALALALLYFTLYPPPGATTSRALVVLTPGSTAAPNAATVVALPGAQASAGVERVPDLATALRRYPGTQRLRIVGDGLPARDRDAARGLAIEFDAPPEPRGVVALDLPSTARSGGTWNVAGRIAGLRGGRVELRDPAGAVAAEAALPDDGRYTLSALAKQAGRYRFELRAIDADGAAVDRVAVPLAVDAGDALRIRVIAGAPDPELKYLRRWALDAGLAVDSRIALSTGIALQRGDTTLDAATLAATDLLIVDERAWATLDAGAKRAIADAVEQGLGLVLRVTGPLTPEVAAEWSTYGYTIKPADVARTVRLRAGADDAEPALTRQPVAVEAAGAIALVTDAAGEPLALWRAHGQGRVAAWWLVDSYRLALAGLPARHGGLWSDAAGTLARARGTAHAELPHDARVGERAALCDVARTTPAEIEDPQGRRVALLVEHDASRRCAGFWPDLAGWHRVVDGEASQWFYVRAADEAATLARAATITATQALAGGGEAAADRVRTPLPRWPFFVGWLVAAGLAWWLEKRRA